ncbi:MAG: RbsD/FucU family protein [Propioniciclava sp.]
MLKGIDPLIGPELLHTLAAMGHGDRIAVVDRNFPAMSTNTRVHRMDGSNATDAIAAILTLLPLDSFVDHPVACMSIVGHPGEVNAVQTEVLQVASRATGRSLDLEGVERFAFYAQTREAYAVVATGEDRPFGCFLLSKGVLPDFTP